MNYIADIMLRRALLHFVKQAGGEVVLHHTAFDCHDERMAMAVLSNPDRVLLRVISKEREQQLRDEGAEVY